MLKMKRLRLLLAALAVLVVTVAVATEPSKTTVRYQGKKYYVHKVKEGDTLYSLARVYGASQESIIEVNGLEGSEIRLGSTMYIPYVEREATSDDITPSVDDAEATHVVCPGETLYSLSRTYGLSEQDLLDLNNLNDYTDIKAGMTLRVKKRAVSAIEQVNNSRNGNISSRTGNDGEMYRGKDEPKRHEDAEARESDTYVDTMQYGAEGVEFGVVQPESKFEVVSPTSVLRVTLLLPFHARGEAKENIVDFYRGVLLAMEDLKAEGYSIELTVLDTKRSPESILTMLLMGDIDTQLIIGPVYDEEFSSVLRFAEARNIPVVSPLQYVAHESPVLFNMPAPASLKGEPIAELLDGSREVVTIYASSNDNNFIKEVRSIATNTSEISLNFKFDRGSFFYTRRADGTSGSLVDIEELMRTKGEKVFVIMASSATDVDRILTTLSSTKSSIRGRGLTYGDYTVVGNREWLKMTSIDHDIFFHNDVVFVVPYYANRIDEAVRLFDGRYVTSYNSMPSRTSYRGYDAAMIFCRMMCEGFESFLGKTHMPLTTPYRFEYLDGSYTNTNWVRQHYRHDSKIVVE
jgi:LysM repeat protein